MNTSFCLSNKSFLIQFGGYFVSIGSCFPLEAEISSCLFVYLCFYSRPVHLNPAYLLPIHLLGVEASINHSLKEGGCIYIILASVLNVHFIIWLIVYYPRGFAPVIQRDLMSWFLGFGLFWFDLVCLLYNVRFDCCSIDNPYEYKKNS